MTRTTSSSTRQPRTQVRRVTLLLAVSTAIAIWAIAAHALGIQLRSPEMGDTPPADITAAKVVIASLVAALAAWAVLAVLERFTARAHGTWITVAVAALLVSLGAPLTGNGIGATNRAVLTLLHLAVAGVIIPGMLYPARFDRMSSVTASTDGNKEVGP